MKRLLLIVDAQYDFMEGGKLAVNGGKAKMEALGKYISDAEKNFYTDIALTADWHPLNHCSFKENGGDWPEHCVAHTHGSAIDENVIIAAYKACPNTSRVYHKGNRVEKDEYSIFMNHNDGKTLEMLIKDSNFDEIHVCGIAGDVCVLNTIKDLKEKFGLGNHIVVLNDFVASIDDGTTLSTFCKENDIKTI